MKLSEECLYCCYNKGENLIGDIPQKHKAVKEITDIIKGAEAGKVSAPMLMARVLETVEKYTSSNKAYEEPKRKYNALMLGKESLIDEDIAHSKEPFLTAIKYAAIGNYIDFGALSEVREDELENLLKTKDSIEIDRAELKHLGEELKSCKRLSYITDNAGEIVLDKVLIKWIKKLYPRIEIKVIVRGAPILNDATYEDAVSIGMDKIAEVIPNGTNVPGTPLEIISEEAKAWLQASDLAIAKGQGNFETLRGCEKNIYYLFLCKCDLFVKMFHVEKFTPQLCNEMRIVKYT